DEHLPRPKAAEIAAWVSARKDSCPQTFQRRLAATRRSLRDYRATAKKYERDYQQAADWFAQHCPWRQLIRPYPFVFICDTLEGRPRDVTIPGMTVQRQFVLKRAPDPPLNTPQDVATENERCAFLDPISLDLRGIRPESEVPMVSKLTDEVKALV